MIELTWLQLSPHLDGRPSANKEVAQSLVVIQVFNDPITAFPGKVVTVDQALCQGHELVASLVTSATYGCELD